MLVTLNPKGCEFDPHQVALAMLVICNVSISLTHTLKYLKNCIEPPSKRVIVNVEQPVLVPEKYLLRKGSDTDGWGVRGDSNDLTVNCRPCNR